MGYRSDVTYAIMFPNEQTLKDFVAVRKAMSMGISEEINKLVMIHMGNRPVLVGIFENIKWYDDYENVIIHTKFIEDAIAIGCIVRFIRVGEDSSDIDEWTDCNGECEIIDDCHWLDGEFTVDITVTINKPDDINRGVKPFN